MNIKPIEGWRRAWRWFSVQAMVLAGALQGAWLIIPPAMQASIHPAIVQGVAPVERSVTLHTREQLFDEFMSAA